MKDNHEPIIRPLRLEDLKAVALIEQSAHDFPWKTSIHLDCIEQRYPSLVLELNQELVAYTVFNYLHDEAHLMNITTRTDLQGRGFARTLIKELYHSSVRSGMTSVLLEVRQSNPAIGFYRKEGFEQIGQRANYYPTNHGREAAIVMQKSLVK